MPVLSCKVVVIPTTLLSNVLRTERAQAGNGKGSRAKRERKDHLCNLPDWIFTRNAQLARKLGLPSGRKGIVIQPFFLALSSFAASPAPRETASFLCGNRSFSSSSPGAVHFALRQACPRLSDTSPALSRGGSDSKRASFLLTCRRSVVQKMSPLRNDSDLKNAERFRREGHYNLGLPGGIHFLRPNRSAGSSPRENPGRIQLRLPATRLGEPLARLELPPKSVP